MYSAVPSHVWGFVCAGQGAPDLHVRGTVAPGHSTFALDPPLPLSWPEPSIGSQVRRGHAAHRQEDLAAALDRARLFESLGASMTDESRGASTKRYCTVL